MKIIKGDLIRCFLAGDFDLIAHGCNCQNIMGAGIAKQIKDIFPDVYEIDTLYHAEFKDKINMMGTFSNYWYSDEREGGVRGEILNMYTQYYPGLPSPGCKIPFDYEAFTIICRKVNLLYRGKKIGLPWIGCGLAGAYQPLVATIINDNLPEMDVTIVEYEKQQTEGFGGPTGGLGETSSTRESIDSSRGRYGDGSALARNNGGGNHGRRGSSNEYGKGAPVKLDNHHSKTTDAAGRHYWIGENLEDSIDQGEALKEFEEAERAEFPLGDETL